MHYYYYYDVHINIIIIIVNKDFIIPYTTTISNGFIMAVLDYSFRTEQEP